MTGGTDASRRKLAAEAIMQTIREDQERQRAAVDDARFRAALADAKARVDRALGREVDEPAREG